MGILDKVADFGGKVFGNKFAQIIFPGIANANQKLIQTYRQLTYKPQAPNLVQPGLQDKKISTADYGDTIPFVFGRGKVVGQLMGGLTELIEEPRYYEIGGGAVELRYHYRYSGYWLLCRGTATAITRLWLNDDLIFDIRSGTSGAIGANIVEYRTEPDGTIYIKRNTDNIYGPEIYRLRLGTETQGPDALLGQIYGAPNISAHRGYVGVSIERLFCDPYFKQVPSVTAEVVVAGSSTATNKVPLITLDWPPEPGSPNQVNPNDGLVYCKFADLFILILREKGGTPHRVIFHGIRPGTHTVVYSSLITQGGSGSPEVMPFRLDSAGPYIWFVDDVNLIAISTNNGAIVVQRALAGLTGTGLASEYRVCVPNNAKNELWLAGLGVWHIFNKSQVLAGDSLNTAKIREINNQFIAGNPISGLEIPHRQWIVCYPEDGAVFLILDKDGNVVFPKTSSPLLGTYGFLYKFIPDAVNDCLWANYRNFGSPNVRDLYKFSLVDFSHTLIVTGVGFEIGVGLDTIRNAVVAYMWSQEELRWYSGSGVLLHTLDISAETISRSDVRHIAYAPPYDEVIVNFESYENEVVGYQIQRTSTTDTLISTIVQTICTEVGINSSDVDTTALSTLPIGSFVIDTRAPARNSIDVLQETVLFNTVMQNGKITLKKKNTASIATIDYKDLVIDEENPQRPYRYSLLDEFDKPARYEVRYSDTDADYETGLEYASRTTVISKDVKAVTLPIGLPSTNAKIAAEILLWEQWAQGLAVAIDGTRKHWTINAGDIFTFNDEEGKSRRFLCTKTELIGFTQAAIEAVFNDESAYTVAAQGAGAGWTPPSISPVTNKRAEIMDIPILEDADDYLGFYVVADPGAPSAFLYESVDGGTNYTNKGELTEAAIGYASTALGNHTAGLVWDDVNTVTIVLYSGGTLVNATDMQLLAGSNRFLLGQEVIQAGTIVNIATNTYTLSHLLRGRHGTEWAIPFHTVGERFVPVSGDTQRIASTYKGVLNYYKVVRTTQALTDVPPIAFTNSQNGAKPYSPVYIQGSRDGSNNLTITWLRRSRIGTGWGSALEIPLGEQSESYQVDIMQGSVVKRTISVTTPTAAYSAADQTTDFGSVQSAVLVNIYQMSATVGRGTPGIATV